jgi:hypothetical protein
MPQFILKNVYIFWNYKYYNISIKEGKEIRVKFLNSAIYYKN